MRYIQELHEGSSVKDIYLCKKRMSLVTKNGKNYENVILQDRTGVIDAKIWDPNSDAIHEFEALDYIYVAGSVSNFNGSLQASLKQVRKADTRRGPRRSRRELRRGDEFLPEEAVGAGGRVAGGMPAQKEQGAGRPQQPRAGAHGNGTLRRGGEDGEEGAGAGAVVRGGEGDSCGDRRGAGRGEGKGREGRQGSVRASRKDRALALALT